MTQGERSPKHTTDDERRRLTARLLIVGLVAVLMLLVSRSFEPGSDIAFWLETISTVVLIGVLLQGSLFKISMSELGDDLSQGVELVRSATEEGLIAVLPPRKVDPRAFVAAADKLIRTTEDELLGIGFTLRDCFDEDRLLYHSLLRYRRARARFLLVDWESEAAALRSRMEQPRVAPPYSKLQRDIRSTVGDARRLVERIGARNGPSLAVGFTNHSPQFMALLGDNGVLIENYHSGKSADGHTCIGGRVPILVYRRGSDMYERVRCHFHRLWEKDHREGLTWTSLDRMQQRLQSERRSWVDQRQERSLITAAPEPVGLGSPPRTEVVEIAS